MARGRPLNAVPSKALKGGPRVVAPPVRDTAAQGLGDSAREAELACKGVGTRGPERVATTDFADLDPELGEVSQDARVNVSEAPNFAIAALELGRRVAHHAARIRPCQKTSELERRKRHVV